MSTEQEILVTGIKVVDLLAPYAKGGKIGMLNTSLNNVIICFVSVWHYAKVRGKSFDP